MGLLIKSVYSQFKGKFSKHMLICFYVIPRDSKWQFYFNLAGSELPLMNVRSIEEVLSKVSANQVLRIFYQNIPISLHTPT